MADYQSQYTGAQFDAAINFYLNGSFTPQSMVAPSESSTTASRAYSVGDYFVLNNYLYRVTAPISLGGTIVPGTNCTAKYISSMAIRWVDISGTSGGSSAVNVSSLAGINSVDYVIVGMIDLDADVTNSKHLDLYMSGNSIGGALLDRAGSPLSNTAFNFRIYYVRI